MRRNLKQIYNNSEKNYETETFIKNSSIRFPTMIIAASNEININRSVKEEKEIDNFNEEIEKLIINDNIWIDIKFFLCYNKNIKEKKRGKNGRTWIYS